MEIIFENLVLFISMLFILYILTKLLNYIIESLFFIIPIKRKYDIMADDISKSNTTRYIFCFICLVIILTCLLLFKILNLYFFIFSLIVLCFSFLYYYNSVKKFTILQFINFFSEDLFNWYKIYELKIIDEETKKQCFKIHCLDYDEFQQQYLSYLKLQKYEIIKKIDKANEK